MKLWFTFEDFLWAFPTDPGAVARHCNARIAEMLKGLKKEIAGLIEDGKKGDGTTTECHLMCSLGELLERLEGE